MEESLNAIVVTSINHPTEAIEKLSSVEDHQLIVVGDLKTPITWECKNVIYISPDNQNGLDLTLNQHLPWNHYSRKMLGYLYAMKLNAKNIIDTDDDNIPYENYGFPEFHGNFQVIESKTKFANIYRYFCEQPIWPRGLPLQEIATATASLVKAVKNTTMVKVGIWQGLADEDPDVDAIYRLTSDKKCQFSQLPPVVLKPKVYSPFNSQNTLYRSELFELMYLPTTVTFRFTDILRSYVALPIMWQYGYHLGFTSPQVIQKRNPHDYFQDFISEIPMYQNTYKVIDIVERNISPEQSIGENLLSVYSALLLANIVTIEELSSLKAWLNDCAKIRLG